MNKRIDPIQLVPAENGELQIVNIHAATKHSFKMLGFLGSDGNGDGVYLAYSRATKLAYYYFKANSSYMPVQSPDGRLYEYDENTDRLRKVCTI